MARLVIDIEPEEGMDSVGLHLGRPESIPIELARKTWKEAIIKYFKERGEDILQDSPFLTISLPCGESVVYDKFEDIPDEDVPCSCGNPRHFFVRHYFNVPISKN